MAKLKGIIKLKGVIDDNSFYKNQGGFSPVDVIAAPENATHYTLLSAGGQIDFENNTHTVYTSNDGATILDNGHASFSDGYLIQGDSTMPVFLVLRLVFYQ